MSELVKKLRINYNKLIMKKKDLEEGMNEGTDAPSAVASKQELVKECMDLIKDDYSGMIYKHDGCRILQQMIKHGSFSQKETIIEAIKPFFTQLMQQKYSYHLACRAYYYAPTKALKNYFHGQINSGIGKLVIHQFAAEVIEYVFG